jgi:PhoPQ-activated pathogenicity-related protein
MSGPLRDFVQNRTAPAWWHRRGRILLESQIWKGHVWRHDILIAEPPQGRTGDTAILEITGDNVADEDLVWARELAAESGLPVFVLCQVPNQPLWDLREDFLIALTFERFLDGEGKDWPLLFPMALAAASALDAIQEWSKGELNRFVVTGASKRGWTTWLLGATGDARVVGLAPRLFDNLHFLRQIQKQKRYWHGFSKEIDPYVDRGLPERFVTPDGLELLHRVDPWYMLDQIRVPVLLIHGGMDPFWMVDALEEYWSDIKVPKWCLISPIRGHEMWPISEWAPTMSAFSHACRGDAVFLEPHVRHEIEMNHFAGTGRRPLEVHLFELTRDPEIESWSLCGLLSTSRRSFTKESEVVSLEPNPRGIYEVARWEHQDLAVFTTINLHLNGRRFPVSLPPIVIDRLDS